MNRFTWLDLYNFLHNKANDIHNPDGNFWSQCVIVHNAETGDEYNCDTYEITDKKNNGRLVLVINLESLYQ
jgi:hypothetical protein